MIKLVHTDGHTSGEFDAPPWWAEHVSPAIANLLVVASRGYMIDVATWDDLRLNSYERTLLVPFLADETLIKVTEQCLQHIAPCRQPPSTYDEALSSRYVPELIRRLKEVKP